MIENNGPIEMAGDDVIRPQKPVMYLLFEMGYESIGRNKTLRTQAKKSASKKKKKERMNPFDWNEFRFQCALNWL